MNLPKRKRMRLDGYDYSQNGAYFITVCTKDRECILSPCPTVGDVICAVKSVAAKTANRMDNAAGRKIWQSRFHDHIIRDEQDYRIMWEYIDTNPLKWSEDCFYKE